MSKRQRKFVNSMRAMGDVPWPARRFKYPPTFGARMVVGQCPRVVGEVGVKKPGLRHKMKKPVQTSVVCGGELVLVPLKGVHCSSCRDRGKQRRELARAVKRAQSVRVHSLRSLLRRGQRGA